MSIARALPYLLLAVVLGAAGYLAGAVTDPFGSAQPSIRGELSPEEPRLRRELEQARGEAAELTGELQRAQATIDRLRADLDDTRTRIAELQQRAEAAEEARAAAKERIGELAERVATLEAEADRGPAGDAAANQTEGPDSAPTAPGSADAGASADDVADGSDASDTAAGASPGERASGRPGADDAASQSDADRVASPTGAGTDAGAPPGQAAEEPSTAAASGTEDPGDGSSPAAASDTAGSQADADVAAIADGGPPGFEEDARPGPEALSSIRPSTRQANRLVAGVQSYQEAAYQEAFLAWLPLARAGYARAQLHLGALFLEGRGTDRNDPLAYAWLTIAQNNGSQNAGPLLDQLRQRMSGEDLDTAQQLLARARQAAGSAG
ncbi:MAG: hypothetical protein U5L06_02100 [Rhodovibrio sp.]|nr:hypothetical protein [Rhodovibrio sp.]